MLTRFRLSDAQLGMLTASPMNRQNDLSSLFIDVGNDVGNQRSQKLLASAHGDVWRIPRGVEIVGEAREIRRSANRIGHAHGVQSRLGRLHAT